MRSHDYDEQTRNPPTTTMANRMLTQRYQRYTALPSTIVDISVLGAGRIYLPSFSSPRPLRSKSAPTAVVRAPSNLLSSAEHRHPDLTSVVPEDEVDAIVKRLSRPTVSTRLKVVRKCSNVNFVDMNDYSWNNMKLYTDYKRTIFDDRGSIKPSFRRCCKRDGWV